MRRQRPHLLQPYEDSGQVIFKCLGPESCLRGGRTRVPGRACGDCVAGYYDTLDEPCLSCKMGSPAEYRLALMCGCLAMVCFLVAVQQAIRHHPGEERKAKSDDDKADNLDDEVARASEWATQFHDHEATAKEVLTSMSLVWKYIQKVV